MDTTGAEAVEVWKELRNAASTSGRWPVILGSPEDAERMLEGRHQAPDPHKDLGEAQRLDGARLLRAGFEELVPDPEEDDSYDLDFDPAILAAKGDPGAELMTLYQYRELVIGLLPSPRGWEAPAHLGYGGWNGYPHVPEHVAMLRHWHERYGAQPMVMAYDTVELWLPEPVRDPRIAKAVAVEWTAYSYDNVAQGSGSVRELASEILGARTMVLLVGLSRLGDQSFAGDL